ncbi:hypothetical protein KKC_14110, partial [Listeria fleischmannii subsp. coloradonensis]
MNHKASPPILGDLATTINYLQTHYSTAEIIMKLILSYFLSPKKGAGYFICPEN